MGDQNVLQGISSILEKVLGSGVALNGQIGINGLTITTVDKAKSLGLLPQQSQQQGGQGQEGKGDQEGQQKEGSQDQQQSKGQSSEEQGKQGQQEQSQGQGGQVSREELNSMMDEIRYLRKLMEQSQQQDSSGQKGKQQGQSK